MAGHRLAITVCGDADAFASAALSVDRRATSSGLVLWAWLVWEEPGEMLDCS